ARHDLLAAERLDDPRTLDDVEARGLRRREASAAFGALAASTNRQPVVARTRIDDAAVGVTAEGAEHPPQATRRPREMPPATPRSGQRPRRRARADPRRRKARMRSATARSASRS